MEGSKLSGCWSMASRWRLHEDVGTTHFDGALGRQDSKKWWWHRLCGSGCCYGKSSSLTACQSWRLELLQFSAAKCCVHEERLHGRRCRTISRPTHPRVESTPTWWPRSTDDGFGALSVWGSGASSRCRDNPVLVSTCAVSGVDVFPSIQARRCHYLGQLANTSQSNALCQWRVWLSSSLACPSTCDRILPMVIRKLQASLTASSLGGMLGVLGQLVLLGVAFLVHQHDGNPNAIYVKWIICM